MDSLTARLADALSAGLLVTVLPYRSDILT